MASYFKVNREESGKAVVCPCDDAKLHEQEIAVFPERIRSGFSGSRVAEFFAQVLGEPPPPRGSVKWDDAQTLASHALEIATEVSAEYGFPVRTSPFSQHLTKPGGPSKNTFDITDHETVTNVEMQTKTEDVAASPSIDDTTARAGDLARELHGLDALSTEMGANSLVDTMERIDGDLIQHLNKLAEVLQLDSSTSSIDILQAAIKKLRKSATRSQACKALRMPTFKRE